MEAAPRDQIEMMKPFAPFDGFSQAWAALWASWDIKAGLGTIIATGCSFFGRDTRIFFLLCIALAGDFLAGVFSAIKRDRFRCRAVQYGVLKIFYYGIYLGIMGLINSSLSIAVGMQLPLLDLFVAYLVATDCISILSHLQAMGVPVPPILRSIAQKVRKTTDQKMREVATAKDAAKEKESTDNDAED